MTSTRWRPMIVCARSFPKGFALDAPPPPHHLGAAVRPHENLDKVYAAAAKSSPRQCDRPEVGSFKYYTYRTRTLAYGHCHQTTPELLTLEKQVIDAVTPFAVKPELCRIRHHARNPKSSRLNRLRPDSCRSIRRALDPHVITASPQGIWTKSSPNVETSRSRQPARRLPPRPLRHGGEALHQFELKPKARKEHAGTHRHVWRRAHAEAKKNGWTVIA